MTPHIGCHRLMCHANVIYMYVSWIAGDVSQPLVSLLACISQRRSVDAGWITPTAHYELTVS